MIEDADERVNEDNQEEDDLEEVSKQLAAKKNGSSKESERKKRELITMGKAKGFLTYDEVNDHMPESIVSSDQIDDWLSTLGGEGIEIVDASSQVKV
jgi:RNA polymerase primary sigma factor